ncbi:MAG: glycosyltransferase [Chitinophagaceae bacterium]|nr:glycosyltransferase [Chitinophagaceae bacterium]
MKVRNDKVIISPSGNLYGSEQVLLDFLKYTKHQYIVYLPRESAFYKKVLVLEKHRIRQYRTNRLLNLYLAVLLNILLRGVRSVYVNEGGHIKYIKLLARFFRKVKFTVHLRMVYDAEESRLGLRAFANIQLIAISNHVAGKIPVCWNYLVIYDPYLFRKDQHHEENDSATCQPVFRVGIIGRISPTKGFFEIALLIAQLETLGIGNIVFHFYGSLSNDEGVQAKAKEIINYKHVKTVFNGFVNQEEIYKNIDCVCHFCEDEGLGRVFFESIDWLKPFIGFKKGGLMEIASEFQLNDFLIEKDGESVNRFIQKLNYTQQHYQEIVDQVRYARRNFSAKFSLDKYLNKVETLI